MDKVEQTTSKHRQPAQDKRRQPAKDKTKPVSAEDKSQEKDDG